MTEWRPPAVSPAGRVALWGLAALHLAALLAGPLAPYDPARQTRDLALAPPTRIRLIGADGTLHPWPFVYRQVPAEAGPARYREETGRRYPLRLLVRGEPYTLLGLVEWDLHLLGVEPPARLHLLGTDAYGRDVLSRLLHGARLSLAAGLLAGGLAVALGTLLGATAGFVGGWIDAVVMRSAELFLALPWLYLLLGVRGLLPLDSPPAAAFLLVVGIVGVLGWAVPGRLVRATVASARRSDYVLAARAVGASPLRRLVYHALPQAGGVIATQAALLVPRAVLAEVTLSFVGLGVPEPVPSWGNLLSALRQYHVLVECWWMLAPVLPLVALVLCYHAVAREVEADPDRSSAF